MVAKKKAAPKKAAAKKVEAPAPFSNEIGIALSITTPDGVVHQSACSIKNASGCISRAYVNDPSGIVDTVREGLVAKYGTNHVKA